MTPEQVIHKCIEVAGGAKELAKKVGVSYKTVLDWKNGRTGISIHNCLKLETATEGKVKKQDILPEYNWNKTKIDEKKELEIAAKMLEKGMDEEAIIDLTGISPEELESIKN